MIDFEAVGKAAVITAYGCIPEAPKGYEFTGEFKCLDGSGSKVMWLTRSGHASCSAFPAIDGPRLILRRKMQRKLVGWTVRRLGRPPEPGEFFTVRGNYIDQLQYGFAQAASSHMPNNAEAVSVDPLYEEIPEPTE